MLFFLAISELLIDNRILSPASFASPREIILSLPRLFGTMNFLNDIYATTSRALLGLALGFPAGLLIAFFLYSLREVRSSGEFALDFIRSIPVTALIPVFITIFGIADISKAFIGAYSASLVTAITIWVGISEQEINMKTITYLYGQRGIKLFFKVIIPYTLPSMVAALKLSISSALVVVIVSEMFIGTRIGIGKVINDLAYTDNRGAQYAAIICSGLLGYVLNRLIDMIWRYISRIYYY